MAAEGELCPEIERRRWEGRLLAAFRIQRGVIAERPANISGSCACGGHALICRDFHPAGYRFGGANGFPVDRASDDLR